MNEELLAKYNEGLSNKQLGELFSMSPKAVSMQLSRARKLGLVGYTVIRWNEEDDLQLIKLRELGKTNPEIATILNRSENSIKTRASFLIRNNRLDTRKQLSPANSLTEEELQSQIKLHRTTFNAPSHVRTQAVRFYGSWTKALIACGVSPNIGGKMDPSKETILYYIDFGKFKKVGITQQSIKARFAGAPNYTVLDYLKTSLEEALELEKIIKDKNCNNVFIPEDAWFERNGKTECFTSDARYLEELV